MNYCETKEKELQAKIIPQNAKADLADFWQSQIAFLRTVPLSVSRAKLDRPYKSFTTYEITYNTHDETIIHAYFSVPVGQEGKKLPCVVYYHGGGGQKSIYADVVATGVCCFAMDVRSQAGTSIDQAEYTLTDNMGNLMARDLTDKNSFYMRNIYLDAVRAMDVVATLPEVDPEKIVTFGASQGGALSFVASAFSGHSRKCYSCVPSYCCLHNRIELGTGVFGPAHKLLQVHPELTDAAFDTLTYFDINNLVSFLKVDTDVCLNLSDEICIPQFVYSPYSHITAPKQIHYYPFQPHCIPADYYLFFKREMAAL